MVPTKEEDSGKAGQNPDGIQYDPLGIGTLVNPKLPWSFSRKPQSSNLLIEGNAGMVRVQDSKLP